MWWGYHRRRSSALHVRRLDVRLARTRARSPASPSRTQRRRTHVDEMTAVGSIGLPRNVASGRAARRLAFRGLIADISSTAIPGGKLMARLTINGKTLEVNVNPSTPLLWAIREQVGLTGTKYGCGIAQCGACTVHLDGAAVRSCVMPVAAAEGKRITTIEGLASGGGLHKGAKARPGQEGPPSWYRPAGPALAGGRPPPANAPPG